MKLYDKIRSMLTVNSELRNSDRKLIWDVMLFEGIILKYGQSFVIDKRKFMNGVSFESITRARRKIQENHPELQASEEVQKHRKEIENQKGTHIYREGLFSESN